MSEKKRGKIDNQIIEISEKNFSLIVKAFELKPTLLSPFYQNASVSANSNVLKTTDKLRIKSIKEDFNKNSPQFIEALKILENPDKITKFTILYGKLGFDKTLYFKDKKASSLTRKMDLTKNEIKEDDPKWFLQFCAHSEDLLDPLRLMAGQSPLCPVHLNLNLKPLSARVLFCVIDIFRDRFLKDFDLKIDLNEIKVFLDASNFLIGDLSQSFAMLYPADSNGSGKAFRKPLKKKEIEKILNTLVKANLLKYKNQKIAPGPQIEEYIRFFSLNRMVFSCISINSDATKGITGTTMIAIQADQHNITGISGDSSQVEFVTLSADALIDMVKPFCKNG